jgi:hypothetical protein
VLTISWCNSNLHLHIDSVAAENRETYSQREVKFKLSTRAAAKKQGKKARKIHEINPSQEIEH